MAASTSSSHEDMHPIKEHILGRDEITGDDANHANNSSPKIKDTKDLSTSSPPKNEISKSDPPDQGRKHLVNLIDQEIKFIEKICPKLGEHQQHIKKEVEDASITFEKLTAEACQLKELKDLKKNVTKLKLQIPAKYRTYDLTDEQKDQQSDDENKGVMSTKLQKIMPRLHNKLFHESPFCKSMQQRYDELRRELKLCLLCFSVFPENALISRRLMVYWWIGEGFVPSEDELRVEKTEEDYANDFFKELMEKDFIEPVSKWHGRNVAVCKMHPMIRAALVMIADKLNFFDFDEYGNPKDFGKYDEIASPDEIPDLYPLGDPREFFDFYNEQGNETEEPIQFLDSKKNLTPFAIYPQNKDFQNPEDRIGNKIDKGKKFYYYRKKNIVTKSFKVCLMGSGLSKGITWEKLHMLFNVKDDILEFKPEWFIRMKNANMVFLGRWQSSAAHHIEVEEFNFEASLEHMNNVRFFSVQGVSNISDLPNSISKLESLLILDLRACHNLEVIPKTIGTLKYLTHLDMSECYLLKDMPKEISCLKSLQVLKGFVVVDSPGKHMCTLEDLINLENLRKLSMYTHMRNFPQEAHLDALQKIDMLRKLTILWGGHESKPKPDESQPKSDESKPKSDESKSDDSKPKSDESKSEDSNPKSIDSKPKSNYSKPKSDESKVNEQDKRKVNLLSRVTKLIPKKQWVKGSMRRMNAFNNSTLGSRLEKLDLKCFPDTVTPIWLTPGSLKGLKKLYIRGGQFSDLGQYQDVLEWDDDSSPIPPKDTWNVEVLRLKYLDEIKMEWRELQDLFPKMTSLEKVKCPRLTLFPCNERGVWTKKTSTTT